MNKKAKTRERVRRHRYIKSLLLADNLPVQNIICDADDAELSTSSGMQSNSRKFSYPCTFDSDVLRQGVSEDDQDCEMCYSSDDQFENEDSDSDSDSNSYNFDHIGDFATHKNDEINPEIGELRNWVVRSNIPLVHVDALLQILRNRLLPDLPKTGKSFINTSQAEYNLQSMKGADDKDGEYTYLGIEKNLHRCIDPNTHLDNTILLQSNVDGVSPFKSSTKQLWPILCKVIFDPNIYSPFPVALFYGTSKPGDVYKYLEDFITEINSLQENGIYINAKKYAVKLEHIICDTPARAFVKQIKGHGGYEACERCTVHGNRVGYLNKRVIYPDVDSEKRSDQSFREQKNSEHHTGESPLLRVNPPIDMIYAFPLDPMHLGYLGVFKKFHVMDLIFNKTPVKLKSQLRKQLFDRIIHLKSFVPCEFQRKPRPPVVNLKASEHRFMLLYAGPIVYKDILETELYNHFLLLHTAFRILCMKDFAQKYNDHAQSYLKTYFEYLPKFYGETCHVLNTHYLLHLADDVRKNNYTLNDISAFPFESHLGSMRKSLRMANNPLAQICRRIYEKDVIASRSVIPPSFIILKQNKIDENRELLLKFKYENFTISTKKPDNVVMLTDAKIIEITNLGYCSESQTDIEITGIQWMQKQPIFRYPTNSKLLDMWELRGKPSKNLVKFRLQEIKFKMVRMHVPFTKNEVELEKMYVMPLLH